ncbi:MAG: PilX N-terminal domain-containing pilus assembly protein [Pseudomonadota bacterium]
MCYLFGDKEERERGTVLVIALLILAVLSLIGISSLNTTTVEIEATGNVKMNKMGFYAANSGLQATPRLVRATLDAWANLPDTVIGVPPDEVTVLGFDQDLADPDRFFNELSGIVLDGGDSTTINPDIQMVMGDCTVAVDVLNVAAGGVGAGGAPLQPGVVFGRGGSGGGGGAVFIQYNFNALGTAPDGSSSIVGAEYRYRAQ